MRKLSKKQRAIAAESKPNQVVGLDLGDRYSHQRLALFRAEDDMDQIQAQRLRHGYLDVSGLQPSPFYTIRT